MVKSAQLSLEHGVATERDLLLVQARHLEAEQAIADADARLASLRGSLEELTGAPWASGARLAAPRAGCAASEPTRPKPEALHRPELGMLAAQKELVEAQDELDRAADRPRIGAFATAGYGRPGLNALSDNFDSYFIGGVKLTVPLTYLYTGKRRNARDQLEVQRSLLARQHDAFMTQVQVELDAQHAELRRLDEALALDARIVAAREGARKQTELQLELGTATMADLIGDLTQEDQVRAKRVVHQIQRHQACHQIDFIAGDL
jgi:outer membrane protein TolC